SFFSGVLASIIKHRGGVSPKQGEQGGFTFQPMVGKGIGIGVRRPLLPTRSILWKGQPKRSQGKSRR
ncbi:MAG: hypothetical protein ACFCU2_09295, partial [Acidimicrobiia bacterium]